VADEQDRLRETVVEIRADRDQIGNVGGKTGASELTFAVAQPGEIEAQAGDPLRRERSRHMHGRAALARAGEAMREQRRAAHQTGRQFQRSGKFGACGRGDGETFGGHGHSGRKDFH
jgi:hypothetical protein